MSGTDEEKPSTKSKKILVGCTGSVASIKIPLLVQELQNLDDTVEIKIMATDHALHFFDRDTLSVPVLTDKNEWEVSIKS